MSESDKLEKRALANAAAGQALTNAWHDRMARIDAGRRAAPQTVFDPNRGCVSPLGGVTPWKDPRT